jgi:RNA polymerase sigma-70 factor (ECF subfamily)
MTATGLRERQHAAAPPGGPGEEARTGTDEEFARALYERYQPVLQGYVTRLTRDVQWAEDIVQAALVRAWRARHQLACGEAATRSWLFTAAYRIFVDEYRTRSAHPVTLTGYEITAADPAGDEAERLTWSVTLESALSALSAPHREAIAHVYYLSRTIDETAAILGISPGTVKSRLYYAVRALRSQLASARAEPPLRHPAAPPPRRRSNTAT